MPPVFLTVEDVWRRPNTVTSDNAPDIANFYLSCIADDAVTSVNAPEPAVVDHSCRFLEEGDSSSLREPVCGPQVDSGFISIGRYIASGAGHWGPGMDDSEMGQLYPVGPANWERAVIRRAWRRRARRLACVLFAIPTRRGSSRDLRFAIVDRPARSSIGPGGPGVGSRKRAPSLPTQDYPVKARASRDAAGNVTRCRVIDWPVEVPPPCVINEFSPLRFPSRLRSFSQQIADEESIG